jgi:hypothetical protein
MLAKSLAATLIGLTLITAPAAAQSVRTGNAVQRPNNQVIVRGQVVGQDPDPNVRLEIRRTFDSHAGGP